MPKKMNFWRQVCHRLTVNTGKFMVYCRSLTWLSPLGKPRLWRQSVLISLLCLRGYHSFSIFWWWKWPKWHHRHRFNIKKNMLKTYKLKKQKHLIWNKKYLKKIHSELLYSSCLLSIRQYSPGNCLSKKILYMKYEWYRLVTLVISFSSL